MSDDGGPAYPCRETFVTLKDGQIADAEDYRWCPGMSLRERFAVALAGNPNFRIAVSEAVDAAAEKDATAEAIEQRVADLTFTVAQFYTDEALARRKQDAGAESGDEVKGEHDHRQGWGDRT